MKQVSTKTFLKKSINKEESIKEDIKEVDEKENKKISGIYAIHNTYHNRFYIGSSKDVNRRIKTHKKDLEKGSHDSRFLQKDYDEIGKEYFNFNLIEEVKNLDLLTAYEKYYIYKYDSIVMYKGYNTIMPTTNHKLFKQIYELKEK